MKKHLLILASLVLGIGQLFADTVTFSFSDLAASLPQGGKKVNVPYTWTVSPGHVSATFAKLDGTEGTMTIGANTNLKGYTLTVTVAGEGKLKNVKFTGIEKTLGNVTVDTGTYTTSGTSGTWETSKDTKFVTFTTTDNFTIKNFEVGYTPDESYTPVDPNAPIEATPIDNVATYDGNDPFVYDGVTFKYYALNNLGKYEEYGVFNKVSTLKSPDLRNAELDYIQTTTAGAYFKTGYIPKTNTKAVVKALVGSKGQSGNWRALFGTGYFEDEGGWKDRFCLFTNTNNDFIAINVEDEVLGAAIYDRVANYELDAATGKATVSDANGTTVLRTIQGTPKSADCKTELYILAQNKSVPNQEELVDCKNPTVTLFGMKIYEGETLVKDFVPYVNADGVVGMKETISGDFIAPSGGEVQSGALTSYEGKIVRLLTDNHVYQYTDGAWVDKGAMTMEELANTNYKNMNNWETNGDHVGVFQGNIEYTAEGNNFINPYVGTGGHEPLMTKIEVTKGDDYCFSFKASHPKYWSWANQDHMVHASVWNGYDLWTTGTYRYIGDDGNNILASFAFQYQTEVTDLPVEMDFTAAQNQETLIIQFGDGDDNNNFWWRFNDVKVAKYVYPVAYRGIKTAEANEQHFTELAYIESVSASRENAFTLPYNPITATQIDTKFQVYDTSTGWCGIFCARNKWAGTGISLYMNGNDRAHFGYFAGNMGGEGDNFAPFSLNTDYEVSADVTKLVVNGETYYTGKTETVATSRNLSLFANPEWDEPMRGRFYYCTISEAGEKVYDFKPVMRHDGVFGFYDEAKKIFVLPAQGTLDGYNFKTLDDQGYIYFTKETRTIFLGFTGKFEPTVQNIENATFTWTSSDPNIATVAADGTVTGIAKGTVTITATTDADQGWTASYELAVEPATVAANNVEVWDGSSDAIVGSIKWGGDQYKAAYTLTFDSGHGWNDSEMNHIYGVPGTDENEKAWYETDYQMTNVPNAVWSYNDNILPNGWSGNMGEVYVRRYFKAEGELPEQLYMPAGHDDAPCEYYINGTLIWARTGEEPGVDGWYEGEVVKLTAEQRALIKTDGSVNVFAYHVHQNWGGRYADGGIYGNSMADNSPSKAFEGNNNRKRLATAVAQAEGVEGFPADILTYCKNATVCLQDVNRAYDIIRFELRKLLAPRHNFEMASAEPVNGGEYWIYNVGAGQFLAGGNDWGTHTSLDYQISQWPMILHTNTSGANRFNIQTNLPNGIRGNNDWLGHNGYVDCGGANFESVDWAWEFQAVGNGNYRIINSQNSGDKIYLGMTEDYRYQVDTDKAGADNLYNQWKLITREQLEALAATATSENPADVSFYITQNSFSQNEFNGDSKNEAKADFSEAAAKWERNAGNIGQWKENASNGDYVFEMWNTASTGKVYLKQTLEGLPAGQYIVECTGFYRDGNYEDAIAGNARQLAYFYAGNEENKTLLPSILDYANMGAGEGDLANLDNMIPNSVGQASRFFEYGNYTVQAPVVNVGAAGTLEIGIYRDAEDVKEKDWIVVDNFRLYRVGAAEATETVTIGEALYATYVAPVDVDFTGAEVSAFAAQAMDGYVHLEPVTTVPAGTAVVVKADAAGTYNVNTTTGASLGATNELIAATADVTADGTQYILAKQDDKVGFAQATTGTIAAGKGYLKFTTAVKAFYPFAGNDATGISGIEAINGDAPIYNVAGQRLGKMQKGINIVGGKKVLK